MPTRISIINDGLRETGNNEVVAAANGINVVDADVDSEEWKVGHGAYDRNLPILLERHPWNFATATEALVQLDEDENPSQLYDYAYEWPDDALWVSAVFLNGNPINYEIVDHRICTSFDNSTDALMAKFVREPKPDAMSNLFFEVMRKMVEAACLRGLNEDMTEAAKRLQEAEFVLQGARNRSDQQTPRRAPFVSRMLNRRRGLV